jgi:hypothetical protein
MSSFFQLVAQVAQEQERYQPTRLESSFAVTKTLIIRALIMYFIIISVFRRPTTVDPGPSSVVPTKIPAFNIFEKGTVMVNRIKYFFQQL